MMILQSSSSMLDAQMGKTKLLTVKFSEEMLAEFHAAAEILGAPTSSALVYQFAKQKIREAKNTASEAEFSETYENKLNELRKRSVEKSRDKAEKPTSFTMMPPMTPKKLGSGENVPTPEELKKGHKRKTGS